MNSNLLLWLSFSTIIIGILSWLIAIPNAYNSLGTLWMLTWVVNPIGVVLGLLSIKNNILLSWIAVILNFLLTISVGPMWFLGDLFGF
ncbi:hypothetical protein ACOJQI_11590 [Bacillus salacetis]|uniref:hypothetical protein n=1 Tax=Bacillus salacetis TaxID=2315464 RepID=UPI003BA084AF